MPTETGKGFDTSGDGAEEIPDASPLGSRWHWGSCYKFLNVSVLLFSPAAALFLLLLLHHQLPTGTCKTTIDLEHKRNDESCITCKGITAHKANL